jgi:two-component system cell cycle sensor histidine kinase/response regulator CckA
VLQQRNYTVLTACHGIEALVVAHQTPYQIDLLITDLVMPQMNGHELAVQLRALCPTVRVLYISGFSGHAAVRDEVLQGVPFLQKPFTADGLLRQVHNLIDQSCHS